MCTYRDNAMDRAGELQPDFRTAVEIEWSKGMERNKDQSGAAVRGEAVAEAREHYFLRAELGGVKFEKEVSVEEFCKAERAAGFRPKLPSTDARYMTTPATGGFGGGGISGSVRYFADPAPAVVSARAADAPSEPSELSSQLRKYAAGHYDGGIAYSKLMLAAADALDSQPTESKGE